MDRSDYISASDSDGRFRLYPIDGGKPKSVVGILATDEVIGGAAESESLYVTPDDSAIPMQILKVNISTGVRRPLTTISPSDPNGLVALGGTLFTADERQYVYEQVRQLSVLYVASGLK